jgi:hypothetical protein
MQPLELLNNELSFVDKMENEFSVLNKHNKISIEKIAGTFNIFNKNKIKELTELAIVMVARKIAQNTELNNLNKFNKIVELYNNQANLSQRTSQSMLLQQYSTPAPISYVASLYVLGPDNNKLFFEPSAGNGLLTIALPPENTYVNELDDIRLANLKTQAFTIITSNDATIPFTEYYKKFDGIATNPPFGTLMSAENYDGYKIKTLDHLMSLRALDCMKDTGRAAIIIGGHTDWDEQGRIQAGKNRLFFNYLYSHYNVEDVILIDGHKLYSRQGTSFNVRLIIINGRKTKVEGFAPLKNSLLSEVIYSFENLWNRVFALQHENNDLEPVNNKVLPENDKNIMPQEVYYDGLIWDLDREDYFPTGTNIKSIRNSISVRDMKKYLSEDKAQDRILFDLKLKLKLKLKALELNNYLSGIKKRSNVADMAM